MDSRLICCFFLYLILTLFNFSFGRREAIEIGIGIGIGGGGGPSPSGSGCPPPPPSPPAACTPDGPITPACFPNILLYRAYLVIQQFKQSVTADPLRITRTWTGFDICGKDSYLGFFCETPPNRVNTPTVASVDFNGYCLGAPTVCGFVDGLPDLALFHANSNNFKGALPDLAGLRFFYELDVSNNDLAGAFPADVLSLNNLTFLDLRFNGFAGAVPPQVFTLSMIQVLFLNNNNFTGQIPADIGFSPAQYLTLANNKLTGPIPSSIGKAADTLIEVLFLNNLLSGCLPCEIGLLTKATVFDAGTNLLTGPIPPSFGCLRKVEQLNLADNKLYGEVPDALCRLGTPAGAGSLMNLSLSDNYFTSVGPSCWVLLKKGVLDARKNCIPGAPDQRPPAECARFVSRRQYCPMNACIPCGPPWPEGEDQLNSKGTATAEATDGSRDRSRESGYVTYSALDKKPNNP